MVVDVGRAATTASTAPGFLRKSGVRISIVVAGETRRMASIERTNWNAPPSGRSSRSTEVMTTCLSPSVATVSASRAGSPASTACGIPVLMLQNAQARVQVSPRIITVACFCSQHSPMFGQAASSQTVCSRLPWISLRVAWKASEFGAFTRIQAGLRRALLPGCRGR
jgi:hypothetical protein